MNARWYNQNPNRQNPNRSVQFMVRWIWVLICLLVLGPAVGWVVSFHHATDGSGNATLLVGSSLFGGLVAMCVVALVAIAVASVGARLVDATTGFLGGASIFGWAAWSSGQVDSVLHLSGSRALWVMALEVMLLGVSVLAIVVLAVRFQPSTDIQRARQRNRPFVPAEFGDMDHVHDLRRDSMSHLGIALGAAILLGGVNAFFFASHYMHGQGVAAAVFATLFGVGVARVLVPKCPVLVPLVGLLIVSAGGYIVAGVLHGSHVGQAIADGSFLRLARPAPLDWAAGLCLGLPMGRAFGDSFGAKGHAPAASRAHA